MAILFSIRSSHPRLFLGGFQKLRRRLSRQIFVAGRNTTPPRASTGDGNLKVGEARALLDFAFFVDPYLARFISHPEENMAEFYEHPNDSLSYAEFGDRCVISPNMPLSPYQDIF